MHPVRKISLSTSVRTQLVDITGSVQKLITDAGVEEGAVHIFIPHTTAAVTINENADPTVSRDITATLEKLVPHTGDYLHPEGNSDAHVKASLMGSSLAVMVSGGKIMLGTWQGIFFCEFDGPRKREVWVRLANSE